MLKWTAIVLGYAMLGACCIYNDVRAQHTFLLSAMACFGVSCYICFEGRIKKWVSGWF